MQKQPMLIAGLGKTGFSIARHLQRQNQPFIAFDTREAPEVLSAFREAFPGVETFTGTLPDSVFSSLCAVVASPGVPLDTPVLQKAHALNIPVWGDIECLAREIDAPVIAITGTNGKSTVTALVGEMARMAGMRVAVAGNIGTPVLDVLETAEVPEIWVLELSSFQLDLQESLRPIAAAILNVTPDHLDRHKSLEAYVAAKHRIAHHASTLVINREDPLTRPPAASGTTCISFGLDAPSADNWGLQTENGHTYLSRGPKQLLDCADLPLQGRHNWQNALAAAALAHSAGISDEAIVRALTSFKGLPHRCQWVRTLDGVQWINDSKGTNTGATVSAIAGTGASLSGKIVLIAGGQGKGADFSELRAPVEAFGRAVVLIGEDAEKIARALDGTVPLHRAATLKDAIARARACAQPGDVVLLSPACASFDMFRDFNHRGECFTREVNAL
ncbi:UDP-N-acetylmuramoyl-L-alanine--D-glutamate ligase [Legionella geestiana]|uniref:UDP-N-acetylmuramoyl-L-alanine--D-glutamate ligase n=1 Tax=Legionella geestiana TaxID=45065 RepID=UPI001091AB69|nr:UDP-N-acetylmuramoyl-L-alanine--D-glutamate ligase [Legionella geestiana]QDQ40395.1 UDP-N-acetylmuramoyl-L-alanine--D-glutamate ligase [Legionella geestiana]